MEVAEVKQWGLIVPPPVSSSRIPSLSVSGAVVKNMMEGAIGEAAWALVLHLRDVRPEASRIVGGEGMSYGEP